MSAEIVPLGEFRNSRILDQARGLVGRYTHIDFSGLSLTSHLNKTKYFLERVENSNGKSFLVVTLGDVPTEVFLPIDRVTKIVQVK